jgi:hypothetical protein
VPRLTRSAFERHGFSAATLITDWATIVGADIAAWCAPERLKWPRQADASLADPEEEARGRPGATLVLAVEAGRALDIQYKARQILERINAYFGYRAVAEMRIVQVAALRRKGEAEQGAPMLARGPEPRAPAPPAVLAGVADAGLRSALERMAEGLGRRRLQDPARR